MVYYYHLNAGLALKLFLPNQKVIELAKTEKLFIAYKNFQAGLGKAENNILKFLYYNPKTKQEIIKKLKVKKM